MRSPMATEMSSSVLHPQALKLTFSSAAHTDTALHIEIPYKPPQQKMTENKPK